MAPARRRAVAFGLWFVPLFAGALALYAGVLPGYRAAVLSVANPLLAVFEPRIEVQVNPADQGWLAEIVRPAGREHFFHIGGEVRHAIYLNLALLPALLLATPRRWPERLRTLAWGALLLFAGHVLIEVGMARTYYRFRLDRDLLSSWTMLQLVRGGTLLGVAQWALLTWRFWLPAPAAAPRGEAPRNAACPCGSGVKFKRCCAA